MYMYRHVFYCTLSLSPPPSLHLLLPPSLPPSLPLSPHRLDKVLGFILYRYTDKPWELWVLQVCIYMYMCIYMYIYMYMYTRKIVLYSHSIVPHSYTTHKGSLSLPPSLSLSLSLVSLNPC